MYFASSSRKMVSKGEGMSLKCIFTHCYSMSAVVKQNSTIQPDQHISACMNCVHSQGWANASLLPRGRRSSDDKRQRGKNNPGCGSFRETQVTQTGKEEERTGERREMSTERQRKCEGDFIIMVNTGYVCPGAVELLLSQSGD